MSKTRKRFTEEELARQQEPTPNISEQGYGATD